MSVRITKGNKPLSSWKENENNSLIMSHKKGHNLILLFFFVRHNLTFFDIRMIMISKNN